MGTRGGQPCATLSIGVADIGAVPEIQKAVEKADKALYAAKRTRNAVVFFDKGGQKLVSYADYRRRAAVS